MVNKNILVKRDFLINKRIQSHAGKPVLDLNTLAFNV